ncbi:MAG: hypothetical protein FWG07_07170 [Treponema sp.]|nr:hypothetical protein [Treponema sp.]
MNGRDNRGRRRPFRGRNSERSARSSGGESIIAGHSARRTNVPNEYERISPPVPNTDLLPVLNCIRCGLPITEPYLALSDRYNGEPVHFDCVMAELTEQEKPETGDVLSYIGGGRFGIIHFNNGKGEQKNFTIKKILEWEDKEKKAKWRDAIADRYSIT